jgi:hypothetical protein
MQGFTSESPRGFYFWSLAPFLLLFLVVMPLARPPELTGVVILCTVELLAGLLLLGLFNPFRFWWAFRGVGAIVFLGYVAYLVAMLFEGKVAAPRRAQPSMLNAIAGLVVFGLPGLWFSLLGRFTMRPEPPSEDFDEFTEDEEVPNN